jgi:hypothetical protein
MASDRRLRPCKPIGAGESINDEFTVRALRNTVAQTGENNSEGVTYEGSSNTGCGAE